MAGRGFGKSHAGAESVRMIAESHPRARIALISSSLAEARAAMVEGENGLLAIFPADQHTRFKPSLHCIRLRNRAQAQLLSAAEPERLRGLQHSHACRPDAKVSCVNQAVHLDALSMHAIKTSLPSPPTTVAEGDCFRVPSPAARSSTAKPGPLSKR